MNKALMEERAANKQGRTYVKKQRKDAEAFYKKNKVYK